MSAVLLCHKSLSPQDLKNKCGLGIDQILSIDCTNLTVAVANTPYIIENEHSKNSRSILRQLSPRPVAKELTNLSLSYGGDNVVALAEITKNPKEYNVGIIGASTSVYAKRMVGFSGSVKDYRTALMKYCQAVTSNSPMKAVVKQKAHTAFQKMQNQFSNELKAVSGKVKARRGTPLTNASRATNIVKNSRSVTKLNVTNQIISSN